MRQRRAGHDPGRVVRDLAVMLADGGDALCDLRTLRDQPALFGPVASDATAWRVIDGIAEHDLLDALRRARAQARARAWELGARPVGPLIIDLDATLVTAHSDRGGAAGTFKGGFGFHPLLAYLDCPGLAGGGQPLAALLRPGNAGANCAADHIPVLGDALEQLPREMLVDAEILVRCDSAGAPRAAGLLPRRASWFLGRAGPQQARARRDHRAARDGVAAGARRRRRGPRQRAGRRARRPSRPLTLAGGQPPGRAPRAPAPRRPAVVHRCG